MLPFLFVRQSLSGGPLGVVAHSLTVTEAFRSTVAVPAGRRLSLSFPRPHGFLVVEGRNLTVWAETGAWHRLAGAPDGIISLGNQPGTVDVAADADAIVSIAANYLTTCNHVTAAGSGHLAPDTFAGACVVATGFRGTVTIGGSLTTGAVLNVTGLGAFDRIPPPQLELDVSVAKLMVVTPAGGELSFDFASDGDNFGTLAIGDADFGLFRNGNWYRFVESADGDSASGRPEIVGGSFASLVIVMAGVVLIVFKRCRMWKKHTTGAGDDPALAPDRTEISHESQSIESIASDCPKQVTQELPASPYDTEEPRCNFL
jgi:hypothetical protein